MIVTVAVFLCTVSESSWASGSHLPAVAAVGASGGVGANVPRSKTQVSPVSSTLSPSSPAGPVTPAWLTPATTMSPKTSSVIVMSAAGVPAPEVWVTSNDTAIGSPAFTAGGGPLGSLASSPSISLRNS